MMSSVASLQEPRGAQVEVMTHINLGGIRYIPLAPAGALRNAVHEYKTYQLSPADETLTYLAENPSAELCREDWKRVLRAASGAASDPRLSRESRTVFARICEVLCRAIRFNGGRD